MNINIRTATPADFSSILALLKEFSVFQKTPEKVTITLEQMENDWNLFTCFVAENDAQQIIGFATFYFTYNSWSGKGLYLDDLYVEEKYRKHKIGSRLLYKVIDFAKKENCKRLRWLVSKWNTNAIEFYKKIGAAVEETEMMCDLKL